MSRRTFNAEGLLGNFAGRVLASGRGAGPAALPASPARFPVGMMELQEIQLKAQALGWPTIEFRPAVYVASGAEAWERFLAMAIRVDLIDVLRALRDGQGITVTDPTIGGAERVEREEEDGHEHDD